MRTLRTTLVMLALAALAVAGVSASAAPPRTAQDEQDIVDTAVAAGSFKTLANGSGRSGAEAGSARRMSPGAARDITGTSRTPSL